MLFCKLFKLALLLQACGFCLSFGFGLGFPELVSLFSFIAQALDVVLNIRRQAGNRRLLLGLTARGCRLTLRRWGRLPRRVLCSGRLPWWISTWGRLPCQRSIRVRCHKYSLPYVLMSRCPFIRTYSFISVEVYFWKIDPCVLFNEFVIFYKHLAFFISFHVGEFNGIVFAW